MSTDFERRLRAARKALPNPDPAVTAATEDKVLAALQAPERSRRRWQRPSAVAVAAMAAVAIAAFGFGLGRWIGPSSGSAATPAADDAPGFAAAKGWNTLSTGITSPPQAPTAIAANVPFATQAGGAGNLPTNTVNALPADGIVLYVVLYPRGERSELDAEFPKRSLPLQLVDGKLEQGFEGISPRIGDYRLEAAIGNWNLDVQAFFGVAHPEARLLKAAQTELDRLIVPAS
jgi:hypothetical protein